MPSNGKELHETLVEVRGANQTFLLPSGKSQAVLEEIDFTLKSGELVALLGPSGCGKSTLVRIASGLLTPTKGDVRYRGEPVTGPNPHIALVFQQFALYPWLTVSQNIEQALIPRGIEPAERRQRVGEVISMIGLDGFEEAYPRELSGGMKQRVGIARALAVRPEVLCMDEPFSQVDALTAETLRNEVVNLWSDREKYPQSICMVSHDINEVAFMASRILIMSANPGKIRTVIENPLPYPRDPDTPAYHALVDRLHGIITGLYLPEEETTAPPTAAAVMGVGVERPAMLPVGPIPMVEVRDIVGLLEVIENRGNQVEIFVLTDEMGRDFTRILLASKAAELLGFIQTPGDMLVLTPLGHQFVAANRKARKQIFRQEFLRLPFVKRLHDMLARAHEHRLNKEVFLEEIVIQYPLEDPKRLFRIFVNWGKFAELWAYQSATGTVSGIFSA